jgi:hypothetical protein
MYLGDGHIARLQRAYALRIYLHRDQVDVPARVAGTATAKTAKNRGDT